MGTIRVFHGDDSEAFTRLVAFWISEQEGITLVGTAHTVEATVAALDGAAADVVLLDTFDAPGSDRLVRAVRRVAPAAAIVVYSGYVTPGARGGAPPGADGYVGKGEGAEALIATIRRVHAARTRTRAPRASS